MSIFFFSSAGYLLKKSAKTNGWSKRWFVLNEKSGKVNQFSWIFFWTPDLFGTHSYEDVLFFTFSLCLLLIIIHHGTCLIYMVWNSPCVISISAWIHKKTRGETFSWCHHSWGVHNFCLYILCYLLCDAEMIYDYIIFALSLKQFHPVDWILAERCTKKHRLDVTTKIVRLL